MKFPAVIAIVCSACCSQAAPVQQYRCTELAFQSSTVYFNPFDFDQIAFSAVFRAADGTEMVVPGFWDGDRTWRLRFAPPEPGSWTFVTYCSNQADAGLEGIRGSLEAARPSGSNLTDQHGGILHASAGERYLEFQDGTPFFYLADTWWAAPSYKMPIAVADNPEVDAKVTGTRPFQWAVNQRKRQGFTVIQWHGSQGMFASDVNRDSPGYIFTRINRSDRSGVAYWQRMDEYYQCLALAGLVANWGVAQHTTLDPQSLKNLERLFRYMIARYGAYPSIFFITQEYNAPQGDVAGRREKVFALCDYVKRLDPYHRALTLHTYPVKTDDPSWSQPWCDWIMDQTGHFHRPEATDYRWIYARKDPKPMLEAELNYEGFTAPAGMLDGKPVSERTIDDRMIRASAYTAIQSGCFGFGYGASGSYSGAVRGKGQLAKWGSPVPSWWDSINNTGNRFAGGTQMTWLRQCYQSVDWWKLTPRPDAIPANHHLLVSAATTKTFLIWYPYAAVLSGHEDLCGTDAAAYQAAWFNPRTGETIPTAQLKPVEHKIRLPQRPDPMDWMLTLRRQDR